MISQNFTNRWEAVCTESSELAADSRLTTIDMAQHSNVDVENLRGIQVVLRILGHFTLSLSSFSLILSEATRLRVMKQKLECTLVFWNSFIQDQKPKKEVAKVIVKRKTPGSPGVPA
jgi:hypothetical protein